MTREELGRRQGANTWNKVESGEYMRGSARRRENESWAERRNEEVIEEARVVVSEEERRGVGEGEDRKERVKGEDNFLRTTKKMDSQGYYTILERAVHTKENRCVR